MAFIIGASYNFHTGCYKGTCNVIEQVDESGVLTIKIKESFLKEGVTALSASINKEQGFYDKDKEVTIHKSLILSVT